MGPPVGPRGSLLVPNRDFETPGPSRWSCPRAGGAHEAVTDRQRVPTWRPGRGPHAGCFVTSPERPSAPAACVLSRGGRAEGQQRQLRLVPTAPPRAQRRRAQLRW